MLLKHILVLTAFAPFVVSHQCKNGDFWWNDKNCCLPHGGPPNPAPPPSDTRCPKDTHYWYKDKGCCAPRQPPQNPTPPKCPTNWEWILKEYKCKPRATPPSPPEHRPSPRPGYKNDSNYRNKRAAPARVTRCPTGLEACPVTGLTGDYECLDTATELESCGGCATLGQGQDCTKIEGAWNVACERGSCKVYTCEGGYRLDAKNNNCVPL